MKVQHNHVCSLCNEEKTCFVFTDFDMLFSSCIDCFEELEQHTSFCDEYDGVCSLCGLNKKVKGCKFENSLFFSEFNICNSCNLHLKTLIELSDENNNH